MNRVTVALAGKPASGKSTIAKGLESRYGFARVSFGDYVRAQARNRGLPGDVASLQTLGRTLIAELGWDAFCRAALAGTDSSETIVVDGVRHLDAHTTLRKILGARRFALVYVEVDEQTRKRRIMERARPGDADESDTMSSEMDQLRDTATMRVDGNDPNAITQIIGWMQRPS